MIWLELMIDMTPSLIQTWGHLDSLGFQTSHHLESDAWEADIGASQAKGEKKNVVWRPFKKEPPKRTNQFSVEILERFANSLKSEMRCGVVGPMGLLPTKVESEGYNPSLEQWKKERNRGWIVDYTSYEILSFVFLGSMSSQRPLLLLFYSNLGESTDQAMGGFKHFLIHHDPL